MNVNPFKTFTLKWWQAGTFQVGMLTLGISIGAYWQQIFGGYLPLLIIMAAVSLAYVGYVWWRQ